MPNGQGGHESYISLILNYGSYAAILSLSCNIVKLHLITSVLENSNSNNSVPVILLFTVKNI